MRNEGGGALPKDEPAAPGREVFPEFEAIPRLFANEVEGLGDDILDRSRPEKGWGGWSIHEQVSHVAWIPPLIFYVFWKEILFGGAAPPGADRVETGGADRMLDPGRYRRMSEILGVLEAGFGEGWNILGRETLGSLRDKTLARRIEPGRTWATGERAIDYFETLVLPAHRTGLRRDEKDPCLFHQTLESAMRHIVWEAFVHLKTIQHHKAAEGLPAAASVPEEGYVALLEWD